MHDDPEDTDPEDTELLTIGQLADAVGAAPSALRYYEELGLLAPAERRSGRRAYPRSAVAAAGAILFMRDVGLSLAEIGQLQEASADPPGRRALLRRKLDDLALRAADIAVASDALRHAVDCPAPDITSCPNFVAVVHDRIAARRPWTRSPAEPGGRTGLR